MKKEIYSFTLNNENEKNLNIFYDELAFYNEYNNIYYSI